MAGGGGDNEWAELNLILTSIRKVSCMFDLFLSFKGEVSPNNNVDWVSRKQFYKPNIKGLSRFG